MWKPLRKTGQPVSSVSTTPCEQPEETHKDQRVIQILVVFLDEFSIVFLRFISVYLVKSSPEIVACSSKGITPFFQISARVWRYVRGRMITCNSYRS